MSIRASRIRSRTATHASERSAQTHPSRITHTHTSPHPPARTNQRRPRPAGAGSIDVDGAAMPRRPWRRPVEHSDIPSTQYRSSTLSPPSSKARAAKFALWFVLVAFSSPPRVAGPAVAAVWQWVGTRQWATAACLYSKRAVASINPSPCQPRSRRSGGPNANGSISQCPCATTSFFLDCDALMPCSSSAVRTSREYTRPPGSSTRRRRRAGASKQQGRLDLKRQLPVPVVISSDIQMQPTKLSKDETLSWQKTPKYKMVLESLY